MQVMYGRKTVSLFYANGTIRVNFLNGTKLFTNAF